MQRFIASRVTFFILFYTLNRIEIVYFVTLTRWTAVPRSVVMVMK